MNNPNLLARFKGACLWFLVLFAYPCMLEGQEKSRDYTWPDKGIYEVVGDTFHSENAILILKEVRFSVVMSAEGEGKDVHSDFFTHLKLKILTPIGLEQNTRILIRKYAWGEIKTLDARTLKKDGKVVDLLSKDIHELGLNTELGKKAESEQLRVAIPGAEVGDEIEIVILESVKGVHTADEIFLNDANAFCLKSIYTTTLPLSFLTDAKCYNRMPRPLIDTLRGQRSMHFSLSNLPSLHEDPFSIPQQEFPFLRIAIRFIPVNYYSTQKNFNYTFQMEKNTWLDYGKEVIEKRTNFSDFLRSRFQKNFASLYDDYFNYSRGTDTLAKIVRFFNYVRDRIMPVDVPLSEFENSADYYLKKNQVLQPMMFYFFDRMFQVIGMNYFVGLGKSKYTGPFDPDFVTSGLVTQEFFGFELNKHFYYFFPPVAERSYEFGEVPVNLRGTDALLISKKSISSPVQRFSFPLSDKSLNFTRTKIVLQTDLKTGAIGRTDLQTLSGNYSTDNRFDLITAFENDNKLAAQITKKQRKDGSGYDLDSVNITAPQRVSPFQFTVKEYFHSNNAIRSMEKDIYAIALNGIIDHDLLPYGGMTRKTAFFPPYIYDDNVKVYLVFNQKVELMNADQISASWSGVPGKYLLKAVQVNETTLLIESDYDITSQAILAGDYPEIGKMQAEAEKSGSLQVIVKMKE
jgi:hypothetical protein